MGQWRAEVPAIRDMLIDRLHNISITVDESRDCISCGEHSVTYKESGHNLFNAVRMLLGKAMQDPKLF